MKRALVVLGTRAWRSWILPFLEDPRFLTEVIHGPPEGVRPGWFDAAVFFSRHDTLAQDRGIAAALATIGIPGIACQPQAAVELAHDKRLMARRAAVVDGIEPIPELGLDEAQRYLGAADGRIVVSKPDDGTEGQGLRLFREAADLTTTGARLHEGGHLLQPFVTGEELSVNMVWHAGRCNVYPPVDKGRVDPCAKHPIFRARACPARLRHEPGWERLVRACIEYMEPFRPSGLVEMEFIRRQDRFYLLDVNPRFSATLRLNAVASRSNPMTDLIAAACGEGQLGERVRVERHALEWPLNHTVDSGVRERLAGCDDVWISTRVTLAAPDEASLAARVAEVRATLAP